METQDILNSKSVKGFIKGSLVLVGLFAILYCGVAAILIYFDKDVDTSKYIEINNKESDNNDADKIIKIDRNIKIDKNINISKHIEIDNNDNIISINKNIKIGKHFECKVFVLIIFLIIFPLGIFITVFLIFSKLVQSYYDKLYGSSNNEGAIINMSKIEVEKQVIHVLEKAIIHDSEKYNEVLQNKLEIIIGLLSKISSGEKESSSGSEK